MITWNENDLLDTEDIHLIGEVKRRRKKINFKLKLNFSIIIIWIKFKIQEKRFYFF